jgi:nicotinamidase-related amidase
MPRSRGKNPDLHGNAPDDSPIALLVIDMINAFEFPGAEKAFPRALAAAKAIAALKARAAQARVPVIYVNDNFGRWRSDFRTLLAHCLKSKGRPIVELLGPREDDYFVLKPKHSGFHSTTLDVLLAYLGASALVLTGVATNNCVLFTAHDAYMRDFELHVPRDCVASETESEDRYALEHMASVLKAKIAPSAAIDFASLSKSCTAGTSRSSRS